MSNYKKKLKVSLVLTCYNCKDNLVGTLSSIIKQTYTNLEIIIIDGQSTDGTVDIIRQFADDYADQYEIVWLSEKDNGIYDAMNKGLKLSSGDVIAFFNDKFIEDNAIEMMVNAIQGSGYSGAHADLIYADNNRVKRYWKMGQGKIKYGWMPGHPTLYLKREVYEKYGMYKPEYRCSADFEFMVRVLKDNENKLAYVPKTIISMYYGGTSTASVDSYWTSISESHKALVDNRVKWAWGVLFLRTIRTSWQFISAIFYKGNVY